MTEELFKKYIHYFGDKPPFPPKHIMETLVRMKDDGTFDEKLKAVSSFRGELREKIEEVNGEKMSINHPIFGDQKYGGWIKIAKGYKPDINRFFSKKLKHFKRHALHALSIEFEPYKNNGKKIKLDAPIPKEFVDLEESILIHES